MKYSRLTKEQFDSLSNEFSIFLASNAIDSKQWNKIKSSSIERADHILDIFSDLVWKNILHKVKFIENISSNHLFLFKCNKNSIDSIIIKSNDSSINLNSSDAQIWLLNNLQANNISVLRSTKNFKTKRNDEIYSLISRGSIISEGQLFIMYDERLLKSSEK
ncbi:MAG: DUF6495 family protein [Flavobacteriaceae bacterium]|nr:DUF6495 family protein [Flavobacteriaceae bacterium]